jgi:SAM-dependent methyltransferase
VCHGLLASRILEVREMMFGTRERFGYGTCLDCNSLTIVNPPSWIEAYYGHTYYSFKPAATHARLSPLRTARRIALNLGLSPRLLSRGTPHSSAWWLRGIWPWHRILDFGAGNTSYINSLRQQGYRHVAAFDPFATDSAILHAIPPDARFDLVMFHHVVEHLPNPREVLAEIADHHLTDRGRFVIRVPLADSWAYEHYRANWVQLDAPRHMFIPTRHGLDALATAIGMRVTDVIYDSTPFQFWGSERYSADEPLGEPPSDLSAMDARARALNRAERGDQAALSLEFS